MTDQKARQQAVSIDQSVLVQAPAGSGKTTLLVERYIALLAVVDEPESILAITFTKKAAAEMRRRILTYLDPDFDRWESHQHSLKDKVAKLQPRIAQWDLLNNPQRMQIRTIDGFCHALTKTMPVVATLGPVPRPADQPHKLYRTATRLALKEDPSDQTLNQARQTLLAWCDHNQFQVESLMVKLLAQREQWLKLIMPGGHLDRDQQNAYLHHVVSRTLRQTREAFESVLLEHGEPFIASFFGALSEGALHLQHTDPDSPIATLTQLDALPAASPEALIQWQGMAKALLTQQQQWRKSVTINEGFAPKTEHKTTMVQALDHLRSHPELASLLGLAGRLPNPAYNDEDWLVLEALVEVLRLAASHLELLFAQTGESDFTAIAAAALRGLGDSESGFSDLALYLDQHIEHILVDEYQDTNWTQFQLIEKLIQGWDSEPHRTLFLVGDPMQSIYRFREAEVGLFVRTRQSGIGPLSPNALQLTQNFRSSATIVDWVNTQLGPLFPNKEDVASGAVAYAASEAAKSTSGEVQLQRFDSAEAEAQAIADHLETLFDANQNNPNFKAAIIVRARSHLSRIVPTLQQRGIRFRAVKLDRLIDRPVVQDLLALTQAIQNPQHKTAVLALLRSPLAGLTLHELSLLTQESSAPLSRDNLVHLSQSAAQRAARIFDALDRAQSQSARQSLSLLVERTWHQLGGDVVDVEGRLEQQHQETQNYLHALRHAENQGLLDDWNDFIEWLEASHTDGDINSDDVRLDVLTMHGAKGLEWDAVIIPSLQSTPNRSDSQLLYWLPFPMQDQAQGVLMAPMRAVHQKNNPPLVELIKQEQRQRQNYEALRLMYVATTRAKSNLYLSFVLPNNNNKPPKPASGSLLDAIWPTVGGLISFDDNQPNNASSTTASDDITSDATPTEPPPIDQTLYRLPDGFELKWPNAVTWTPDYGWPKKTSEVEFNWAGTQARRSGTVIHQLLEWVAQRGIEHHSKDEVAQWIEKIPLLLRWVGTHAHRLKAEAAVIEKTFLAVLASTTGQWLLSGKHQHSHCEYPVSGVVDGVLIQAVVDRTFVDETGTRWIIDYKSGHHAGGNLEEFLTQEADRYRAQLKLYERLFIQMGDAKVTTALYLPRHDALKIVD